jgi:hypothetical protein
MRGGNAASVSFVAGRGRGFLAARLRGAQGRAGLRPSAELCLPTASRDSCRGVLMRAGSIGFVQLAAYQLTQELIVCPAGGGTMGIF